MTLMEFFGSLFIGFGPPLVLFIFTIARNPLMVIILMASAFFWLLSLLLTSILWFAVVPLREHLAFTLLPSIFFQELMRILLFKLLNKAEVGLLKMASDTSQPNNEGQTTDNYVEKTSVINPVMLSYVSGLGFGLMGGAMVLINLLNDMTGPGTIGLHGEPESFFLTITLQALAMILLNMFLSVIIFDAFQGKKKVSYIGAVFIHLLIATLTLLNSYFPQVSYVAFIIVGITFMAAIGCAFWAYVITKSNLLVNRVQTSDSSPQPQMLTPQPT